MAHSGTLPPDARILHGIIIMEYRGEAVLRNTCANGIQVRNAVMCHTVDIFSNKNIDFQVAISQSL